MDIQFFDVADDRPVGRHLFTYHAEFNKSTELANHMKPLLYGIGVTRGLNVDVYSEEEARRWLQETGWRALERKPLAGPVSVIVAETAQ
jgi:hypothetical protein